MKSTIAIFSVLLALVAVALLYPHYYEKRTSRQNETEVVGAAREARIPASGQRTPYQANKNDEIDSKVEIPDDGKLQTSPALRYVDNKDGTITDLNTGLMWEKKCSDCDGLHSVDVRHHWSGDGRHLTIWDWIDQVNSEGGNGFAGHNDWRIPNVKELVSIVDYGRFDPAIDEAFNAAKCDEGCSDLRGQSCSCTNAGLYWSSTTFSDFPAHALIVEFSGGFVDDRIKTNKHFVRAVRGAL